MFGLDRVRKEVAVAELKTLSWQLHVTGPRTELRTSRIQDSSWTRSMARLLLLLLLLEARGSALVKALCHKLEGCGFETR
jgi:hypothetical protein